VIPVTSARPHRRSRAPTAWPARWRRFDDMGASGGV
jgi:hypothetical protein